MVILKGKIEDEANILVYGYSIDGDNYDNEICFLYKKSGWEEKEQLFFEFLNTNWNVLIKFIFMNKNKMK